MLSEVEASGREHANRCFTDDQILRRDSGWHDPIADSSKGRHRRDRTATRT
jgi:hypothetical protein